MTRAKLQQRSQVQVPSAEPKILQNHQKRITAKVQKRSQISVPRPKKKCDLPRVVNLQVLQQQNHVDLAEY